MANKKISELLTASQLDGTELLPLVQSNATVKATAQDIADLASGLIGQELDGTQRDFAAIIDKDGYFALGTSTSNITSSEVYALDGQVHEIFVLAMGNKIMLFIDGDMAVSVNITMHQNQFWRVGFMWTYAVYQSRVRGKCYGMGIWTASYPTDNLTLPTM